ncbi:hypothetical protein [Intestinimonas butyriciproducens]|uniref:hypothetical protein n=1 Tax=Intestinimonas butyriciproducens TaxID=1297617 RepID=UPI0034A4F195
MLFQFGSIILEEQGKNNHLPVTNAFPESIPFMRVLAFMEKEVRILDPAAMQQARMNMNLPHYAGTGRDKKGPQAGERG